MRVLGIDPGGRQTGIVVVDGDEVIDGTPAVKIRTDEETCLDYAVRVALWLRDTVHGKPWHLVAIEGVVAPNPHMGLSNPAGLVDTAVVFGALCGHLDSWAVAGRLVEVRPGGHGDQPAILYPPAVRGRAPLAGDPGGDRRHVRSAYDVALAGRRLHRLAGAS